MPIKAKERVEQPVRRNLFGEPILYRPRPLFKVDDVADAAFYNLRESGFPYPKLPLYRCMLEINRLSVMGAQELQHTHCAYRVADTYHPHRYEAHGDGLLSPIKAFNDDRRLRLAILFDLSGKSPDSITPDTFPNDCDFNRSFATINFIRATQAAYNFRPGFACYIYRKYCKPGYTVLDTSTGYGGRLVGFMASGIAGQYIGIDPNTKTHASNQRMASDLGFTKRVRLFCKPAEEVDARTLPPCDFAFTSPPYFCKEHYSDEPTQSYIRYKTGDEWRRGFLIPMLRLQFTVLKPGAFSVINIADVKIKGQVYPLVQWTVRGACACGFTAHDSTSKFITGQTPGINHKEDIHEALLVFRKPR